MPKRWNSSAQLRKTQIESGIDITFCDVFRPYFLSIVKKFGPSRALEIGAGTGHLAEYLTSGLDIKYFAIEPSQGMYEAALDVIKNPRVTLKNISIQEMECDDIFDIIICHLCAHVVEDFSDLIDHVLKHLSPQGYFVFTLPHPCFYNMRKQFFDEKEYHYMKELFKEVDFFISLDSVNAISGVPYHHRPLSYYINIVSSKGMYVCGFDEIMPDDSAQSKYGGNWEFPWYCSFICQTLSN